MLRPLRSIVSLALLLGALWAAFAVDLGGRSFAEHVDTISQTPEAEELIEGTRATINPALAEVRDRLLGEYVEAPTWISADDADAATGPASADAHEASIPAAGAQIIPATGAPEALEPMEPMEPALPGRRRAATRVAAPTHELRPSSSAAVPDYEPALPGRRR